MSVRTVVRSTAVPDDATNERSSSATSPAVVGRLEALRATKRACKATSGAGAPGTASESQGGSSRASFRMISMSVPAPHMGRPIKPVAERLLRRHVSHLAFDLAGSRLMASRLELCDAEVQDFDVSFVRYHDVVGAHVAVHDVERLSRDVSKLVRGMKPLANLSQDVRDERFVEFASAFSRRSEHARKRLAFDVLHREKELVIDLAEGECSDHVGVREQSGEARLAQEHLFASWVACVLGEKALECNDPVNAVFALVERYLDAAHSASSDDKERPVAILNSTRLGQAPHCVGGRCWFGSNHLIQCSAGYTRGEPVGACV